VPLESTAPFLTVAAGEVLVVVRRVRHRHRGAIDELDLTAAPLPLLHLPLAQPISHGPQQALHQPQRQTLPRFAVRPRIQTARRLPETDLLADAPRHRILAGVIRAQDLLDEQQQDAQRAVHPLSMAASLFAHPLLHFSHRDDLAQQRLA